MKEGLFWAPPHDPDGRTTCPEDSMWNPKIWAVVLLLQGALSTALANDRYRASHAYFSTRSFDGEVVIVMAALAIAVGSFIAYLAVSALQERSKRPPLAKSHSR